MKKKLVAEQQELIVAGLNKLHEEKYNKYKRLGTPSSIEALDEYKAKLEELNNLAELIEDVKNSKEIAITVEAEPGDTEVKAEEDK